MIKYIAQKLNNTVEFTVSGADTERFLTKCTGMGIEVKNPKKYDGYKLSGRVYAMDYKKLRNPARKMGLKLKLEKKHGAYFFAKKHRNKIGFILGISVIYFSMLIMNMFIWEIEVKGNERVETFEIMNSAEQMGLKKGTLAKSHTVQDMEWYIVRENEGLASAEINIQGSRAQISVSEMNEEPEMMYDDDMPVNIIASRYGVIRKIDVFDGQGTVKPGDAVMKGDLLVSAVYEDRHNKLTLKHSRANIVAETDYTIEVEFPLEQKIKKTGGVKKTVTEIEFLGLKIRLENSENCEGSLFETEEKKLRFFWIELPINLITTRYFAVKENTVTYNFEQGKSGAYQLLFENEQEQLKDCEILSKKLNESVKNGKYIIKADYICLMEIGEEQPIESNIPWENTDDMS